MGISNEAQLCYGIEFKYAQVKHLKQQCTELVESIGCDSLPNLWSELGLISYSDYYDQDEEYHNYIIGKELKADMSIPDFLDSINAEEICEYIMKQCLQYNLPYTEPKLMCRVNVY